MTLFSFSHKDLNVLLAFIKAEFKTKYRGSILGITWYLLNPLLLYATLYLIFAKRFGTGIEHYPVYLLIGIIQWNFFQTAVGSSLGTIWENRTLVKSISFKRELIVIAPLAVTFGSHLLEILLLAGIMTYLKMSLLPLAFLPALLVLQVIFALGFALALSSIFVYVSDVQQIWTYLSRIWWFGTPIFYAVNEDSRLFWINIHFNPQFGFIHATRALLINTHLPTLAFYFTLCAVSILTLTLGYAIFHKLKDRFAELV